MEKKKMGVIQEIAEKFIKERGFEHMEGFAINTIGMNPEEYDEILFAGARLEDAMQGYFRHTDWWAYEPSDYVQAFEDIWDAVEYAEEATGDSFEKYRDKHLS